VISISWLFRDKKFFIVTSLGRDNPTVNVQDEVEMRPHYKGRFEGETVKEKEYLDVVLFAEESALVKWALRIFSVSTLGALVFLWVYYR
jgi:hypothetical protein